MGSQELPHILLFDCSGIRHGKPVPESPVSDQHCTSITQTDELYIQL